MAGIAHARDRPLAARASWRQAVAMRGSVGCLKEMRVLRRDAGRLQTAYGDLQ